MQLDQTTIEIRERGFLELLDLALRVFRRHIGPLLAWMLVVMTPLAALNYWLLEARLPQGDFETDAPSGYLWNLSVLMIWQAPLATAPLTIFLGQAMFRGPLRAGHIAGVLLRRFVQLFLVQGVLRGLLAAWCVWAYVQGTSGDGLVLMNMLLLAWWAVPHAFWPYTTEIILLEGNRLFGRHGSASTIGRSWTMHGQATGELLLRWLFGLPLFGILLAALWLGLCSLTMAATLRGEFTTEMAAILYPVALWLVIGYLAVVRFLSYLDLRIRNEGWEVELMMRAEGNRIGRQLA